MQILININENDYKTLMINGGKCTLSMAERIVDSVYQGTPLPKGHGDLKDMEDIYEALEGWNDDTGWIVDTIDNLAPTIIEADKKSEEV